MENDPAKSKTNEGQNEEQPPKEPEAIVKPPEGEGESKGEPEGFEQKYKTLMGHHTKLQKDYTKLEEQQADFKGVCQRLDELSGHIQRQGETLSLHTEILSAGAEYNEDIQQRLNKAKEAQETEQKQTAERQKTTIEMSRIAKAVKLEPADELLKPAWEALGKGEHDRAIELTIIAAEGKVSAIESSKSETKEKEETKPTDKEKLKQLNVTPAGATDTEDLTPRQRILKGIAERDKD